MPLHIPPPAVPGAPGPAVDVRKELMKLGHWIGFTNNEYTATGTEDKEIARLTLTGYPTNPIISPGLQFWVYMYGTGCGAKMIIDTDPGGDQFTLELQVSVDGGLNFSPITWGNYITDSGLGWQQLIQFSVDPSYYILNVTTFPVIFRVAARHSVDGAVGRVKNVYWHVWYQVVEGMTATEEIASG